MDFIVDEVMKFKHINATDGNAIFEGLPRTTVEQNRFSVRIEKSELNGIEDVVFPCAVEDRSSDMNAS